MTTLHLIDKLLTLGIFVVIATAVWSIVDFHRILTQGFHLKPTRQICA